MSRRKRRRTSGLSPLRTVLLLVVTLFLVTAPVVGVVTPIATPGSEAALALDSASTAGNDAELGTGSDEAGLGTAGNDGGIPQGTLTPDPNQSSPAGLRDGDDPHTRDASTHISGPANVTLVTGTTVTVIPRPNESEYVVHGDTPTETVHTDRGTYVFPTDTDLSAFDRALFNVDLLVAQNFTDAQTDSIPVVVTGVDDGGGGVGPASTGSTADEVRTSAVGVDGVTVEQSLSSVGAVAGQIDKARKTDPTQVTATGIVATPGMNTTRVSAAESLRANDAVGRVYLDQQIEPHLDDAVNATRTYRARKQFDVSGEGVSVAVLDTGVDSTHPDLAGAVVESKDFTGEGLADDPVGHGTHVAGIIAGDGTASDGRYVGYAPNASVLNGRVLGPDGGSLSDVIAGVEWAVAADADVISMSLGGGVYAPSDPLTQAVESATDDGVTVVVSAGNDGYYGTETIGTPGIAASAITVGATDDADRLTEFSSRGPTPYAKRVKPDLVAPGAAINSTCSPTSGYDCMGPGTPYVSKSGTSMSAPAVSGVAALLEEQEDTDGDATDDLTPAETKTRLITSADVLPNYTVYQSGSGRLNATRALESDLRLSVGTVSAGDVVGTNETVNVTITNTGENKPLLPTSLVVENRTGGSTPGAARVTSLRGDTVILAPGASKTITVELDANVTPGSYSARLQFGDEGNPPAQRRTVSIGWQAGLATLTVEKVAASGDQSDVGFDTVEVAGQNVPVDVHRTMTARGTADFELPVGNYTVASAGTTEGTGEPTVVVSEVSLTENRTVTLDESDTVRYRFDDSALAADRVDVLGSFVEVEHADSRDASTAETSSTGTTSVRVSGGAKHHTSVGFLAVPNGKYDFSPSDFGDGEAYALAFYTAGVDSPETFTPAESSLSTLNVTTYRTRPTGTYRLDVGGFATRDARYETLGADLGADRTVTFRVNTDAGHASGTGPLSGPADSLFDYALTSRETVDPTTTDRVTLNDRPFTGLLDWQFDNSSSRLLVDGVALADQGRTRNAVQALSGRVTVTESGTRVVGRDLEDDGAVVVNRTARAGETYLLRVQVNESSVDPEPRATMVAEGTNYLDDGTPPQVERIDVPALGYNGGVPAEKIALNLTVSDDGENVSGVAGVTVRYAPGDVATPAWEDGTPTDEWTTATVVDGGGAARTATLDLTDFPAERLSIAVRVTDRTGNTVTYHSYESVAVGKYTGDTAPPTPTLSGRIVNDSGVPSTNDTVLYSEDGRGSRLEGVVTNGTGSFTATPDNGTVELTYLQTNYPATTPRTDTGTVDRSGRFWETRFARDGTPDVYSLGEHTVDGPTDFDGRVTLPEAGTLNVSVVNESGVPVQNASVVVQHHAPDGSATTEWRNETNADGLFQNGMTARPGVELHGDVTITVSPPEGEGYVDRRYTQTRRMNASDDRIEVTLAEMASISGRIETPGGNPSVNDRLSLRNPSNRDSESSMTDDRGRFSVRVSRGSYESVLLQTTDDGSTAAPRDGVADVYSLGRVNATGEVELGATSLPRGHTLNVSVVDAWGAPIPTADVTITHDRDTVTTGVTFGTDERGRLVAREGGPLGVEVPQNVTVAAVTGSDGSGGPARSLTVTEDRNVTLAVPRTAEDPFVVRATPAETTVGEPVRVTLNRSRDGAPVDGTVEVNGTAYETGADGAVNVTLNESGNYVVAGRTELETGRVVTSSVSIDVEAPGSGGSGGGGGGGGGTPIPPAGIVDVQETDAGARLTAEKVKGGRLLRNLLPNVASENLTVRQFAFKLRRDNPDFAAEFDASDSAPEDAPPMDGAVAYLDVETTGVTDTQVDNAKLRFDVSRAALDTAGVDPADVTLYRYHAGEWHAVETRRAAGTTYVGVTPGFSVFAVGVQSAGEEPTTPTATPAPTPTATTSSVDAPSTTETTGPGFGLAVAVVALLAVALLARRRD